MKNKSHLSCESQSDYNRLITICNSYGLNQEETNQLILEFQKGVPKERSKDLTFSEHKFQEEEYSFKDAKKMQERYHCDSFQEQSLDQDQLVQREFIPVIPTQKSNQERCSPKNERCASNNERSASNNERSASKNESSILEQTKQLRHLYIEGQKELQRMGQKLQQKDNQIDGLIEMNRQNIDIIKGLKDCIASLIGEQNIKKSTTESVFTARECSMSKQTDNEDELEDVFPRVAYQPVALPPLGDLTSQSLNLMSYLKDHRKSEGYEGRKEGKDSKISKTNKENREQKPMKIDTSRYRDIIASLRKDFSKN